MRDNVTLVVGGVGRESINARKLVFCGPVIS